MKNILFIFLLLHSFLGMGQGLQVAVFIPGQGWATKSIYDTQNPPTSITGPTLTNSTLMGTLAAPNGVITNSMLAGSITAAKLVGSDITLAQSQVTNLVTGLAAKQGVSAAATSATTGTMTVTMTSGTQTVFTITPTGACTFNASGGLAGGEMNFQHRPPTQYPFDFRQQFIRSYLGYKLCDYRDTGNRGNNG